MKSLREQCFFLKKANIERRDYIRNEFKPQFISYIGNVEDIKDIIKTLKIIADDNPEHWLFFNEEIPFDIDFALIEEIKNAIKLENLNSLKILEDKENNKVFLKSLDYVLDIARKNEKERFKNKNIEENFITTIVLLSYQYLKKIEFSNILNNKCIYYGNISKNNIYFLILLYRMMFDVIYINLNEKESPILKIDIDCLSEVVKSKTFSENISLEKIMKEGKEITEIESTASMIEKNVEQVLYGENTIIKDWQFVTGNTKPIFLNGSLSDIYGSYLEEAKLREAFEVKNNIVKVPHFFMSIEGINEEFNKYQKLYNLLTSGKSYNFYINTFAKNFESVEEEIKNIPDFSEKFSELVFTRETENKFDIEKLKKVSFFPLENVNKNSINFILNKINETLNSGIFLNELNSKEKIIFVLSILYLNKEVIKQIENFDFANQVPKIIFFIENNKLIDKFSSFILIFLNEIGFDIILLSPNGRSGIGDFINNNYFTTIRLGMYKEIDLNKIKNKISTKSQEKKINIFNFFNFKF